MVLRDWHDKFRARLLKKRYPGICIKLLRLEHGNEILIPKGGLRAIRLDVMLEGERVLDVHIARIPLVIERGHRVNTPVNKNTEFSIDVPIRYRIRLERFPIGLKRTPCDRLLHRALRFYDIHTRSLLAFFVIVPEDERFRKRQNG